MRIHIKAYDYSTESTTDIGNIQLLDGQLSGDLAVVEKINAYFNHGTYATATYQRLIQLGVSEKDAKESIKSEQGMFSLHSQSPAYKITDPFHDLAQFKALISCMGWYSDDLSHVDMPSSTWDDSDPLKDMDDELKAQVVY